MKGRFSSLKSYSDLFKHYVVEENNKSQGLLSLFCSIRGDGVYNAYVYFLFFLLGEGLSPMCSLHVAPFVKCITVMYNTVMYNSNSQTNTQGT